MRWKHDMPTPTARQVAIFDAIMRSGSVTSAAQVLGLTQPGASRALAETEARLGLTLFLREGRGLRPTPEAKRLHAIVRRMYLGLDAIGEAASRIAAGMEGTLRLVALPVIAETWGAAAAARFAAARPEVTVTLETTGQTALLDSLRAGAFDIGLCETEDGVAGTAGELHGVPLHESCAIFVTRPEDEPAAPAVEAAAFAGLRRHRLPVDSPFERRIAQTAAPSKAGGIVLCTQTALLEAVASSGGYAVIDHTLAPIARARGLATYEV